MFGMEMKLVIGALIDRGANACLTGADQCVFCTYNRCGNVGGIANNNMKGLQICDSGGKAMTQNGPIICIFFQTAWDSKDKTIISAPQIAYAGVKIYNTPMRIGSRQCLKKDGYIFPLDVCTGLKLVPFTDEEWHTLPHVLMTAPGQWDSKVLDFNLSNQPDWYNTLCDLDTGHINSTFDKFGNYRQREPMSAIFPILLNLFRNLFPNALSNTMTPPVILILPVKVISRHLNWI